MNLAPELIAVLGIAVGLISYMWLKNDKLLERKVDNAAFEELKESVAALDIKFDTMRDAEHGTAICLAKIEQQLARMVSHLESERGTRARADERLEQLWIGELRSLRHSITSYGRRKSDPPDTLS